MVSGGVLRTRQKSAVRKYRPITQLFEINNLPPCGTYWCGFLRAGAERFELLRVLGATAPGVKTR